MNTRTIAILIAAALVSLGAVFYIVAAVPGRNQDTASETTALESYTAKQVESHNSKDDCWTIINNSVYDITSYIPRHPGGDEILEACGRDATRMFTSRTDEAGDEIGSGTPHSSSAEQQLEQLKIGTLAQ